MRKNYVYFLVSLFVILIYNCKRSNPDSVGNELSLFIASEHQEKVKDSTHILNLKVVNMNQKEINLHDGSFELQFTSSTSGITKSVFVNFQDDIFSLEQLKIQNLDIGIGETISHKIDIFEIIKEYPDIDILSESDNSIRLVYKNSKEEGEGQNVQVMASNAIYLD